MKKFWNYIVLAVLGGAFGLQEFYVGRKGLGITAALFCWTCIPALVAFIEAVVWLFKGEEAFNERFSNE
jgi:TM2 domain-containing membrane protein YozV